MLIHLFGSPSSWGLGAGSDSSLQASSCTCELKWSGGGQRQYCGGKGGKRILHLWTTECRVWSIVLVCMLAQSYTTIASYHSKTIQLYHTLSLFHPGLTCNDIAITIILLHCSWATCNNGSPSYTKNLYTLRIILNYHLYSHDYQPGFSRLLMQQLSQSNVPKCLGWWIDRRSNIFGMVGCIPVM